MKKNILFTLFVFQAIILSLCLLGFIQIKDAFLPESEFMGPSCATPILSEDQLNRKLIKEVNPAYQRGEKLFNDNCTTCHSITRSLTGPKLENICLKYATKEEKDWLYSWIRNSPELIFVQKDPRAIALFEQYGPSVMNPFPNLSDQDIEDMLIYIQPDCFSDQER